MTYDSKAGASRRQEELRILWEAAAVLLTSEEPHLLLQSLFKKLGPHFGLDTYFNFVLNETGDALRLVSCAGIPEEDVSSIQRLEFGQAVCGTVAMEKRSIVATHIQESDDPKVQLVKSFGLRAYACYPLMAGDRFLGTLSFASRSKDRFDEDELEFLSTICRYVAAAYERLRLIAQLREADRRKNDFLALLAHELRNPLAPISHALDLLEVGVDGGEEKELRRVMKEQVAQMSRLIDDLLDVSRISQGRIPLQLETLDLRGITRSVIDAVGPTCEAAEHEITLATPKQAVPVRGDGTRLSQVVSNLLTNACKYTPPGGRISLTLEQEADEAVLRVRDNGVGIPSERSDDIFDMFIQLENPLERGHGGLGLGLALVKSLTELHGGSVQVRSAGEGRGSEFIVRLPVATQRGEKEATTRSPFVESEVGLRVLVVEDSRAIADVFAMLLRALGHEVEVALDGSAALERVGSFRPDVIFCDIAMPGMSGYEVVRRLRLRPELNGTRYVAVTGFGQPDDREQVLEAGFDHHMVKPVDMDELRELLASVSKPFRTERG